MGVMVAGGERQDHAMSEVESAPFAHEALMKVQPGSARLGGKRESLPRRRSSSLGAIDEEERKEGESDEERSVSGASPASSRSCGSGSSAGTASAGARAVSDAELLAVVGQSLSKLTGQVNPSSLRSFEGVAAPSISMEDYLKRLVRYLEAWKPSTAEDELSIGKRSLVMAMVFLDRLLQSAPGFQLSELNVHRLALVGFLVSVKVQEDVPFPNAFWAKVGGVPLAELNHMEITFLQALQFRVYVRADEFDQLLARFHAICLSSS
jgi:hypothetical protein